MRAIKFRVWTGKKMIYQDKQYLASFIRRIVPEIIRDHGGEAFSQHESYLPNGGVIDEYLMQFTGLLDKNGKEIYEGDILRIDWHDNRYPPHYFEVKWDAENAGFAFEGGSPMHDASHYFEVVGNRYEPPELLRSEA